MRFCPFCKFQLDIERTVKDKNGVGFFVCKNCDYATPLEDKTILFEFPRRAGNSILSTVDPVASLYDNYPRKKIEKCSNKGCVTKDLDSCEVIVWKDDSFNVRYICVSCNQVMSPF